MITNIEDLIEELKKQYPDKMLLDDFPCFQRGKEAGHIEVIELIESLIAPETTQEDESNERY